MFKGVNIRGGALSGKGKVTGGRFLGIDSSMSENSVSNSRADGISRYGGKEAPGCVNMIRTQMGEVSKRPGYRIRLSPSDNIGGVFRCCFEDGDRLYIVDKTTVRVYTADFALIHTFSLPCDMDGCNALQSGDNVMLINGECFVMHNVRTGWFRYILKDGRTNADHPDDFYLPTLFIASTPDGAGESFEAVNLLSPYVAEQYISDGSSLDYSFHLESSGGVVRAYIKSETGEWIGTDGVGISEGKARFEAAPPLPSVEGEDNVRIVYRRASFEEDAVKIAGCKIGTLYGVAGYKDRAFLSSNAAFRGYVFYSQMDEARYFPDINYLRVGGDETSVMALAGEDTSLAVICNDNVYVMAGGMDGNNAVFTVNGIFKTPTPSCVQTPQVFDGEVVYLTDRGVCAITASGVLDERCSQIRSAFLNYHLFKEDLSGCVMIAADEFLVISNRHDRLYLLDARQFSTAGDVPFSRRQYEGYVWTGIDAKYLWQQDGSICFSDGKYVFSFNKGFESNNEYRDETDVVDGVVTTETIAAYWETPYIYCSDFHLWKFFMRMGLLLGSKTGSDGAFLNTDVKISAQFDNSDWRILKDYSGDHRLFRYGNVNYPLFTYRDRPKSYAVYRRLLHKRGRGIKFRFENDRYDEPFTLLEYCVEYNLM